jgi:hypothetical protein
VPTENVKFSHDGFFIFTILTIYLKAAHPHAAFFISRSYMTQIALMPNKFKHGDDISLTSVYVEQKMLVRRVDEHDKRFINLESKLDEILVISKAIKASWKYVLILIFVAFMCGLAVDNQAVVKAVKNYFTLN